MSPDLSAIFWRHPPEASRYRSSGSERGSEIAAPATITPAKNAKTKKHHEALVLRSVFLSKSTTYFFASIA